MNLTSNSNILLIFLLPEFLNSGNTGPDVGGKTCRPPLGFKGNEIRQEIKIKTGD